MPTAERQAQKEYEARRRAVKHMHSTDWTSDDATGTDDYAYLKPEDVHFRLMVDVLKRLESIDNRLKDLTES